MGQSRASKDLLHKTGQFAGAVGGAIASIPSQVKGAIADVKRGNMLYDQGYGPKRANVFQIAKEGKSQGKRR